MVVTSATPPVSGLKGSARHFSVRRNTFGQRIKELVARLMS